MIKLLTFGWVVFRSLSRVSLAFQAIVGGPPLHIPLLLLAMLLRLRESRKEAQILARNLARISEVLSNEIRSPLRLILREFASSGMEVLVLNRFYLDGGHD